MGSKKEEMATRRTRAFVKIKREEMEKENEEYT